MAKHTPIGRVSFPELYEATQVSGQGDFKYRLTLIFEPNAKGLAEFRADIDASIKTKWPAGLPPKFQHPLIDGDETDRPECAGKVVLRLTSGDKYQPGVVNADMRPISRESGLMYSGCFARCSYHLFGWTFAGKSGVSVGMNNVQKIKDGEPLDGRTNAEDDFEAYVDEDDSEAYIDDGDF